MLPGLKQHLGVFLNGLLRHQLTFKGPIGVCFECLQYCSSAEQPIYGNHKKLDFA